MTGVGLPTQDQYREFKADSGLKDFLGNVFKQVDENKYVHIYDEAVENSDPQATYNSLLSRAKEAKGGTISRLRMGLNALKGERDTLAANLEKVLDPNRPKDGYVEIGMPGRMIAPLKSRMGVTGNITVVNEKEDLIQSGFPRPYHEYIPLTYAPLNLEPESVEVVSAFAGLHHCPEDKLEAFIQSIHAMLKPGGLFLLREHDARDPHMYNLATVIHSVFNAATETSLQDELVEVRNFKSLNDWIALLEKHGFRCVSNPLIRQGDSTENALLKFVKVGHEEEQLDIIREKLISRKPNYTRSREQTHLTTVEWLNVESCQNVGRYQACWDYPYFRDIGEVWKGFYHSWNSARQVANLTKVATSEHTVAQTVLATLMTVEYLAKGILYTPLWAISKLRGLLPNGKEDKAWRFPQETYRHWLERYGKNLEQTTFYAQRYLPFIKTYWTKLSRAWSIARKNRGILDLTFDRQTVKNVVTGIAATVDMIGRAAIATPINWLYGGQEQADDREIGVIVKADSPVDPLCQPIEEAANPYKAMVLPRYGTLEFALQRLAHEGAEIVEIAGQREVQVDLIVEKDTKAEEFGFNVLYERAYLLDPSMKLFAVNIPVKSLTGPFFNTFDMHRLYDF